MRHLTLFACISFTVFLLLLSGCGEFAGEAFRSMMAQHSCETYSNSYCKDDGVTMVTSSRDVNCRISAVDTVCPHACVGGKCLSASEYEDLVEASTPDAVKDDDGDGVQNGNDLCPDTPGGSEVTSEGCPIYRISLEEVPPDVIDGQKYALFIEDSITCTGDCVSSFISLSLSSVKGFDGCEWVSVSLPYGLVAIDGSGDTEAALQLHNPIGVDPAWVGNKYERYQLMISSSSSKTYSDDTGGGTSGLDPLVLTFIGGSGYTERSDCESDGDGDEGGDEGDAVIGDPIAACRSDEDCPKDEFCYMDGCGAQYGECITSGGRCMLYIGATEVCGCDGKTYDSLCLLQSAGVSLDHEGACSVIGGIGGGCTFGSTRQCGTDVGKCDFGTETCQKDGTWGSCVGAIVPDADETCGNDKDDDCDGSVDEGCSGGAGSGCPKLYDCYVTNGCPGMGVPLHSISQSCTTVSGLKGHWCVKCPLSLPK